jgi:hypothetical protein
LANGLPVRTRVTASGIVVTLPGPAPDLDVSIAALEFADPIEVRNAAPLPLENGASGTLIDPSKTPH